MENRRNLLFVPLLLLLLILGAFSQWPTTITPDAAMHAEIVEIVKQQGFITTWEPYAENEFTYPPLFHYTALILPLNSIDAVRALGLIIWLLFPLAIYFLISTYDKKAGMIGAFLIGLVPAFSTVFIYGEFPQLLGMFFLVWEWYFLRKERYGIAGIFVGLVALTHVFFVLIAGLLFVAYLYNKRESWVYVFVPVLISLPWAHAYITVVRNVIAGTWENTRYNATQPVWGFWPMDVVRNWLFGMQSFTPILLLLALLGLFYTKDKMLKWVFGLCVAFTIFHIPFTQLKIYDFLVIPTVMLASIGLARIPFKKFSKSMIIVAAVLFLAYAQVQHFQIVKEWWLNPEIAPIPDVTDAAAWLGEYDHEFSIVYAHQASAWVGILSHKYPLNPDITHLETFSDAYNEQLMYRERVKAELVQGGDVRSLLAQRDVRYVIAPLDFNVQLELLYSNGEWGVWG